MRELSIFIDESGDIGSGSKYYLLSLVFHDQSVDIDNWLMSYERSCAEGDLPRHTFHFTPILRGHPPFGSIDFSTRKALLGRFRFFVEKLPFKYAMFSYEKRHFIDTEDLQRHMQLDISSFILDNLDSFQRYEQIKIYYDNGQSIVSKSVHGAIDATLFNGAIVYRDIKPSNYRLFRSPITYAELNSQRSTLTEMKWARPRKGSLEPASISLKTILKSFVESAFGRRGAT